MKKLITSIIVLAGLSSFAQTNVIDTSPMITNSVKIACSSNQWEFLKLDYKLYKGLTRNTNITFSQFQDLRLSEVSSNHMARIKAQKITRLLELMKREPSEAKIDAALNALR
tara:strand:- start:163 stop:498 length:336 start_codon:yes stop_codon:yes gene_type:complete